MHHLFVWVSCPFARVLSKAELIRRLTFVTVASGPRLKPGSSTVSPEHDCQHGHIVVGWQGPQTALLGPLKEVLESMTGGYEVMKEVVAALQDTERGKTASMTVLLQELQERQASKPSREEQERLRLEVSHH